MILLIDELVNRDLQTERCDTLVICGISGTMGFIFGVDTRYKGNKVKSNLDFC